MPTRIVGVTRIAACAALVAGLAGCDSGPEQHSYPMLVGAFADETDFPPLVADEAYINESDFFVRYAEGDERFYAGGSWSDRIPVLDLPEGEEYQGPFIVPLQYRLTERWPELPGQIKPVRMLSSGRWVELRRHLFAEVLPAEEQTGIALRMDVDDYFLYYDADRQFQSVVLENKPQGYEIIERVAMADMVRAGFPTLESYLQAAGIEERRIAFNTGDRGHYALPFLYINRDLPVAVFVRLPGPRFSSRQGSKPASYIQTAGHLAGSHTTGMLIRPVSSIYRLLFVTADTVLVAAEPTYRAEMQDTPVPPVNAGRGMDLVKWESRLDEMTGRESSSGTMRFLVDGEEFFARFVDAVAAAESSISLRTYIFDNDDYASRIGNLLKRRSRKGIETRVLLDGLGTIISTIEQQHSLPENHEPPLSVHNFLESGSNIEVRQAKNPWLTGDHVKTAIIDEKVAFTGGMNIAREYRYDWHDLMVELQGPIVGVLQHEFEKAWDHAGFLGDLSYLAGKFGRRSAIVEGPGASIRALFTRVGDPEIFRVQREAIRNARKYIYVENAYFTDDAMLYELAKARRRGVDVRVIMPLVTDRGPITRNNALAANAMLEHGIRVFIYPGMSHVKAALYDDWACLGSANWDRWSFRINKELNIATSDSAAVQELKDRIFQADFDVSVELTEPFPERWSDYLIEIVGDYIF